MTPYVGAIDAGTTSTRFIVFDTRGRIVAQAQREHAQIFPRPGWVEHDPVEIWRNTLLTMRAAMVDIPPGRVAAVGIANQRETTIVWDRATGRPIYNALVWQDTRTDALVVRCAKVGDGHRVRKATGLPLSSYFSALKLRWLLDNVRGARRRAEKGELAFGTVDCWLAWHLTGGIAGGRHITDVTNASRTQLMNLRTLRWDPDLLDAFAIPATVLPTIVSSSAVHGTLRGDALTDTGIAGVPLAGLLGDQQAALFGQACFAPGDAKNTYGTGAFVLMNTGAAPVRSKAGLLTTLAYKLGENPPAYALEGSIAVTGALVQWLRDLGLLAAAADIEALARTVEDNGDVYIVPAFSGLYAPWWDARARGIIAGLTGYATKGHLARAALEAAAFQTRDVLRAMARDTRLPIDELRCDGAMAGNDLLMQFQADILDMPTVRPRVIETTALGAAYAAGLAVGIWPTTAALAENWAAERRWQPGMVAKRRVALTRAWRKAVDRSRGWIDG